MGSKLSPQDKNLIFMLILIFSVLLVIVFFEFTNKMQEVYDSDISSILSHSVSSELSDLSEKLSVLSNNDDASDLRKYLKEIFNLMNSRNYEELFSLISEDFKKDYFNDNFDNFKQYMEKLYIDNEQVSPKFTSFEKYEDTYVVEVTFLPYDPETPDIAPKNSNRKDIFTIKKIDNSRKYTFSFSQFVGKAYPNRSSVKEPLTVTLTETTLFQYRSVFNLNFENSSESAVIIPNKTVYCYTGSRINYYPYSFVVPPNGSTSITFTVHTGLSIPLAVPTSIGVHNVKINEDKFSFNLPASYCIDL